MLKDENSSGNIDEVCGNASCKFSSRTTVGSLEQTKGSSIIHPARKANLLPRELSATLTV
jgi:hypothetical protein